MDNPSRPKSRRPDAWPPLVLRTVERATNQEVLIPFESVERVKEFKKVLLDVRRSFREHGHPRADAVNGLRSIEYRTIEIKAERPAYDADHNLYPYTICLSPAMGFMDNLEQAIASTQTQTPESPPVSMSTEEFEAEIAQLMMETESDPNAAVDFIRSRKR